MKNEFYCPVHEMTGCALHGYKPAPDYAENTRAALRAVTAPDHGPQRPFVVVPVPTTARVLKPQTARFSPKSTLDRLEYPRYTVVTYEPSEYVGSHRS